MYHLTILPKALDDLSRLDKSVAQRIADKLERLSENAEGIQHHPLAGGLAGLNKLRAGDWRVIYEIDSNTKTIYIHKIGHRSEIYK